MIFQQFDLKLIRFNLIGQNLPIKLKHHFEKLRAQFNVDL